MTDSERASRAIQNDAGVAHNVRTYTGTHVVRESPWVRAAREARLAGKVLADMHTDVRTSVVRETVDDVLRRTMPRGDEADRLT